MAGSYNHTVADDGRLRAPADLCGMLECSSGDVYEAVEEYFGMVWYLADGDAERVEEARQNYRAGLDLSPGTRRRG